MSKTRTLFGALLLVSWQIRVTIALTMLMLATGALAQTCPSYPSGQDFTDDAENYGAACTVEVGGTWETFGKNGLCLASINSALSCANVFFSQNPSNNYTIQLAKTSVPISVDLSRDVSQTCADHPTKCGMSSAAWELIAPHLRSLT